MVPFEPIAAAALRRHPEYLERRPAVRSADELAAIPDDRWLAAIGRRVFEAGSIWRGIERKWDDFEAAFHRFDPVRLALADERFYERALGDERIVRNRQKVMAIAANAEFVLARSDQHDGFGRFVAQWPGDDVVGLWKVFATEGCRLGGNSAAIVLRRMGWDTFILTDDVVRGLLHYGGIDRPATGWRQKKQIAALFCAWRKETGWPLAHLSLALAFAGG